jgi:hypothetical protein
MIRQQSGPPPENGAARSTVPPTPRADLEINTQTVFPIRKLFDGQVLAEFAGYVVLAWREDVATDGTKLGFAKVRLPIVADTDLVVSFHCNGGRLWAEAAPDTPRRCRRRLESALPTLCQLIARGLGGEAIGRMLRQRDDQGGADDQGAAT